MSTVPANRSKPASSPTDGDAKANAPGSDRASDPPPRIPKAPAIARPPPLPAVALDGIAIASARSVQAEAVRQPVTAAPPSAATPSAATPVASTPTASTPTASTPIAATPIAATPVAATPSPAADTPVTAPSPPKASPPKPPKASPPNDAKARAPRSSRDGSSRKNRAPSPSNVDGPKSDGWRGVADQRARITMAESSVIGEGDEDSAARVELSVKLNPGAVVPGTRYKIIRWLGEGGMGVVYECEHVDIERRVALKILRPGVSPKSRKAKMFREEARAVSRATAKGGGRGSNIVEVYDFGELPDGRMWFAMELLEGRSLAREATQHTISTGRMIGILRQVCKGLAAAHDAGVIHRDIKPGNIMLIDSGGRTDTVKIVDFGVAAMLTGEKHGDQVQLEGTPIYMAPEQAAAEPFDHRLDIYAVGAMAFHVIAGIPPFTGDSVFEILRKIRNEPARRITEVNPDIDIPLALEEVILRCLEKKAEARYADMRDLEAALCEAQITAKIITPWDDLPVPDVAAERKEAILRGMPERVFRRSKRAWLPYAAAGAIFVLGVGSWAVFAGDPAAEEVAAAAIAVRVEAARDAAARALFIYPPPDAADTRTAYAEVVELEGLAADYGKLAAQRGAELRHEFAETLVRLGDMYWDRDGGQPFAIDYYIGALVFEPTNAHARLRAPITPGELVALREKAANLSFTEAELSASRTLTALAEEDEDVRVAKLIEIEQEEQPRGLHAEIGIKSLIAQERVKKGSSSSKKTVATAERKPKPESEPAVPPSSSSTSSPSPSSSSSSVFDEPLDVNKPVRASDREAAKALVNQGYDKLRSGKRDEAERLFHRALDRHHGNARALAGLARVAFERGDYEASSRYGKRAVAASPSTADYRLTLGDAYFKMFHYREAREQYQKAKDLGGKGADSRLEKVRAKLGQ